MKTPSPKVKALSLFVGLALSVTACGNSNSAESSSSSPTTASKSTEDQCIDKSVEYTKAQIADATKAASDFEAFTKTELGKKCVELAADAGYVERAKTKIREKLSPAERATFDQQQKAAEDATKQLDELSKQFGNK